MSNAQWLALSRMPGVGGATLRALLDRFGTPGAILAAPEDALLTQRRVNVAAVTHLHGVSLDALEEEIAALAARGIRLLTPDDYDYPVVLREPGLPPYVLYIQGALLQEDEPAVAVVGARAATSRGLAAAERISGALGKRGITVVSGLALGIDTAAHRAALASGGRTLAVLPSGCEAIHPRENSDLALEIAACGALASEHAPETRVRRASMMMRDALTVHLSRAVIVVEANNASQSSGQPSGSLDTAIRALKQGRTLYGVPGSEGTDALIERGTVLQAGTRKKAPITGKAIALNPASIDWNGFVATLRRQSADGPDPAAPERTLRQGSLF